MSHLDPIAPVGGDVGAFAPLQHFLKFAQLDAGLAPVIRLEEHATEAAMVPRLEQIRECWPDAELAVFEPTWSGGRTCVVLVAGEREDLQKAATVERILWRGPADRRFGQAMVALGRLLGFPRCCVEALARSGRTRTREVEKLRICRALDAGHSPMPPFLVPTVPCRPDCPRLAELVEGIAAGGADWIDRWAETYGHGVADWRAWSDAQALLLLDRPGQLMVLRLVEGDRTASLVRYEPLLTFSGDPRVHRLVDHETLRLEEGAVTVAAGAPEPGFVSGEVALVDRAGPFDASYWRRACR